MFKKSTASKVGEVVGAGVAGVVAGAMLFAAAMLESAALKQAVEKDERRREIELEESVSQFRRDYDKYMYIQTGVRGVGTRLPRSVITTVLENISQYGWSHIAHEDGYCAIITKSPLGDFVIM
jgi:hypothetical protein